MGTWPNLQQSPETLASYTKADRCMEAVECKMSTTWKENKLHFAAILSQNLA